MQWEAMADPPRGATVSFDTFPQDQLSPCRDQTFGGAGWKLVGWEEAAAVFPGKGDSGSHQCESNRVAQRVGILYLF